jgi:glycosyltransferase involved in cell wall biosynthesis
VLAGIVHDEPYFQAHVAPYLDGDHIRYVGSVGPTERDALLGGAFALLHLIAFAEPFGLSVVEAIACGTPVIATARGSMPEVVDDGVTGFLVRDLDEAETALARVPALDRREIRAVAVRRFAAERMVDDYIALYTRLLGR